MAGIFLPAVTAINMGGAAIGNAIKGENPINSMAGAGAGVGSIAGGGRWHYHKRGDIKGYRRECF